MGNGLGLEPEEEEDDDALSYASSSAHSLEDTELRTGRSPQAVIIFDWDDTLMCSTAIKLSRKPDQQQVLRLEEAVGEVLRAAMRLGRTAIVTNANVTWVRSTAGQFMPSVVPLLDLVDLVSARQSYGRRWPGDHSRWKRLAFRDVIGCGSHPRHSQGHKLDMSNGKASTGSVNLVVVGDSIAEIQAGRALVHSRRSGDAIVKTVKLKEAPSVGELRGQLLALARALRGIVVEDRSSNKLLVRGGSSACGWSVRDTGCGFPFWDLTL